MTPSTHASDRIDDAVAFRLHRTNRLLLTHLARFLDRQTPALTPERWFIVARLAQDGPMRQVDLTEPALIDAPNVSRLVEALVRDGLVDRGPDPSDRRARVLTLTAAGTALVDAVMTAATEERMRVFDGFSDAELDNLVDTLARIDENVRTMLVTSTQS